jgi:hypothetical protein
MYSQIRKGKFQWLWDINWRRQMIDPYTDTILTDTIRTDITHTDTILMLIPMDIIHTDTTHTDIILMFFPMDIINTDTNTTTVDKLSPQQEQLSPT